MWYKRYIQYMDLNWFIWDFLWEGKVYLNLRIHPPLVTLKPIDLIKQFSATPDLNPLAKKGCSVQAMLLKSAVTNTFVISLKDNREHAEWAASSPAPASHQLFQRCHTLAQHLQQDHRPHWRRCKYSQM